MFRPRVIRRKTQHFRIRSKRGIWMIAALMIVVVAFQLLWMLDHYIQPMLYLIAESEVKKIAQDAMLQGVKAMEQKEGNDLNQVLQIQKGQDGRITFVQVNAQVQAGIYDGMTSGIQAELKQLKGHTLRITLGELLHSTLFSLYGPTMPVQMWPEGDTRVTLIPDMQAQGINMVMVTLNMHVHTEMSVVVPYMKNQIPIDFDYPIAQALVVGQVPEYYYYNDLGGVKKMYTNPITPPSPTIPIQSSKGH